MPKIEKITSEMFDDVYETYLRHDDPLSAKRDWNRLFQSYHPERDDRGYALIEEGRIVGMLGMIFSRRMLGGQTVDFCNLHSWFVDEQYRGYSLLLMRPALSLQGVVLTDFTPTPPVVSISKRLGFHEIDGRLRILLPSLHRNNSAGDFDFISDPDAIRSLASEAERKLLYDHPQPEFGHALIRDETGHCLIITSRVVRHWLDYCYILHVSDAALFARASTRFSPLLKRRSGTRYVAVNARQFASVNLPSSFRIPFPTTHLVRGTGVDPELVDSLYSEIALLHLTTMPSVSQFLPSLRR